MSKFREKPVNLMSSARIFFNNSCFQYQKCFSLVTHLRFIFTCTHFLHWDKTEAEHEHKRLLLSCQERASPTHTAAPKPEIFKLL